MIDTNHHNKARRSFLNNTLALGSLLPFTNIIQGMDMFSAQDDAPLQINVFSKHLQFLSFEEMASAAADIGFSGVELTVRPKGHVEPENVVRDLPKAIAAIAKHNLQSSMIVTNITKLDDVSKQVLETAAALGVKYYRLGYYRYPKAGSMPEAIQTFQRQIEELAAFSERLGIQGAYQNHAGAAVGASMWEVWQLLENTPLRNMGSQYDIRHAIVEGGGSWKNGLRLIHDRINTIVLKDFKWEQINGEWKLKNTPLGQGMVDFNMYFKLLKQYQIHVPVSMHFEYDLFGAEHGDRDIKESEKEKIYMMMKRDLDLARQWWQEA